MDDAVPGQAFRRVADGYAPEAVDDRIRELQRSVEAMRARLSLAEQTVQALHEQLAHRASSTSGAAPGTGTTSGTGHQGLAARIEQLLALAEDQAADLLAAAEREATQLLTWAERGLSPDDWAQARGELQAQLETGRRPIVQAQLETALRAERARGQGGMADGGGDASGPGRSGGWFSRRRAARSPGRTAP